MTIFQILNVAGGLAFFLFGMHVMSNGLKEAAGGKMEEMLQKMTDHPAKSFILGAFITIAIQSSSALTVMLVGLVNSGIMNISQTVGIIMGSNVGTTLTAWILGTNGIETDNIFLEMLKPECLSLLVDLAGVIMLMAAIQDSIKQKEVEVDEMVEKCNQFLINLSSSNIIENSAGYVADMLQGLGDKERISDYSVSLTRSIKKMKKKFPEYYTKDFKVLKQNISEVLTELEKCYAGKNFKAAKAIQNRAYSLVTHIKEIRKKDIKGLRIGKGDAELSVYMTEYLTSCRRVVEHAINIAGYLSENV